MKKPMPVSLAMQLSCRFNEIQIPEEFEKLPAESLDRFFFEEGWLVFVKRKEARYLCVKGGKEK